MFTIYVYIFLHIFDHPFTYVYTFYAINVNKFSKFSTTHPLSVVHVNFEVLEIDTSRGDNKAKSKTN